MPILKNNMVKDNKELRVVLTDIQNTRQNDQN